jgi:hypothetical protein
MIKGGTMKKFICGFIYVPCKLGIGEKSNFFNS